MPYSQFLTQNKIEDKELEDACFVAEATMQSMFTWPEDLSEEKVDYLRYDISKKKIDFIEGAEKLFIDRENVLQNSMEQFRKINCYKEIIHHVFIHM